MVWKITKGISENFTRAHESLKLGVLFVPFIRSRKCMNLSFLGEFCVMEMKNDAKFGKESTSPLKADMESLINFDPSTQKYQKFAF